MPDFKQTGIAVGVDAQGATAGASQAKTAFASILESAQETAAGMQSAWSSSQSAASKFAQTTTTAGQQAGTGARTTATAFQQLINQAQQLAAQGGNAIQQFAARASSSFASFKASLAGAREEFAGMTGDIFSVQHAIEALIAVLGLEKLVEAQSRLQAFTTTMEALNGNSLPNARAEMGFLDALVNRLGLDLLTAQSAYGTFSAATQNTALQGSKAREIFTGVSEAITAMHLPAQRAQLVFLALQEIAGQNTLTMQHLTRQLGMELPGSVNAMAKGLGMTVSQMRELVTQGKILSADALPAMARALHEQWGTAAEQASDLVQASMNKMSTAVTRMLQQVSGGEFAASISEFSKKFVAVFSSPQAAQAAHDIGTLLAGGIRIAGSAMQFFAEHSNVVKGILGAMAASSTLNFLSSVASYAITAGRALLASALTPWGALVVGLTAAVGLLVAMKDETINMQGHTAQVKDYAVTAWESIRASIGRAWDSLKLLPNLIRAYGGPGAWDSIKSGIGVAFGYFSTFLNFVVNIFHAGVDVVSIFATALYSAPAAALDNLQQKFTLWKHGVSSVLDGNFGQAEGFFKAGAATSILPDFSLYFADAKAKIKQDMSDNWVGDIGQKASDIMEAWGARAGQRYADRMKKEAADRLKDGTIGSLITDGPPSPPAVDKKEESHLEKVAKEIALLQEQARATQALTAAYGLNQAAVDAANAQHQINDQFIKLGIEDSGKYAVQQNALTKAIREQVAAATALASAKFYRKETDDLTGKIATTDALIDAQKALNTATGQGVFAEIQAEAAYRATAAAQAAKNKIETEGKALTDAQKSALAGLIEQERLRSEELARLQQQRALVKQLMEAYQPQDTVNAKVAEYTDLLKQGLITQNVFNAAVRDLQQNAARAYDDMLMRTREWKNGAKAAMDEYARSAQDAAANTAKVFSDAFSGLEDVLAKFFTGQKANFTDFLKSMGEDLARLVIRQNITGPLAALISGKMGAAGGGLPASGTPPFLPDAGGTTGILGGIGKLFGLGGARSATPAGAMNVTASTVYLTGANIGGDALTTMFTDADNGFDEMFKQADGGWRNLFASIAQNMGGQGGSTGLLGTILGMALKAVTGGGGAGAVGETGGVFDTTATPFPFAMGGVMSGRGPVPLAKYAKGGIARGPQVALFGEDDPEAAFVPLPDGRRIPVALQGGGGGHQNLNVAVNLTNRSSTQLKASQRMTQDPVRGVIVDVMLSDIENNGPIGQAIRGGIAHG